MSTVVLRLARWFPEPDPLVAFHRLYRASIEAGARGGLSVRAEARHPAPDE